MKALVIGQLNGSPDRDLTEVLKKRGIEPVFLTAGIRGGDSIARNLSRLIKPFDTVNSVFFLKGWEECPYARILNALAAESGKVIKYEWDKAEIVKTVIKAVEDGTGFKLQEIVGQGKQRRYYFARLILIHYLTARCSMGKEEINGIIGRESVIYCKKQFGRELKYNPEFRAIYISVVKHLNKSVSE